jgi:hypothetical protein
MGAKKLNIIEHIWGDTLELREGGGRPPLAVILSSLLAAPMICFTTKEGCFAPHAFVSYAADEVLPGTSLADVLFEEFGLEISDETIVIVEPFVIHNAPRISSKDLGEALGNILVDLAGLNQNESPMTREATRSNLVDQSISLASRRTMVSLVQ